MIRTTTLAALLAAAVLSVAEARAATLDFTFSFLNPLAPDYIGRVDGIVRGLTDNTVSAARSVEVTANEDGFGVGEYLGIALGNAWRVESGRIVSADLLVFGALNADAGVPGVTEATLRFRFLEGVQQAGLNFSGTIANSAPVDILFERIDAPLAPVPLPAGGWLMLTGLGAIAALRRRRAVTAVRP
jgi:hypothetical protein